MTNRRKLIVLAASAFVVGSPGDPAAAQVFVDPGSPTGKEYAIPLEDARRNAAGGGGDDAPVVQGERTAPLFGEGVGDDAAPSGNSSEGDKGAASGDRDPAEGGQTRSGVANAIAGTSPVSATVPQGGFDSAVTIGALALSVLLIGGVLGSIARRRSI